MHKRVIKVGASSVALAVFVEAVSAHNVECFDPCVKEPTQVALPETESEPRAPAPERTRIIGPSMTTTMSWTHSVSSAARFTPGLDELIKSWRPKLTEG